jgi:exodeoxyribonuclease V beta subunit
MVTPAGRRKIGMVTPRFDLLVPLPAEQSTTVLEASAGTGKTFALAGLATRYLAEGKISVGQILMITFGRVASRELRERVRSQIVSASDVLDGGRKPGNELERYLLDTSEGTRIERRRLLRDALAGFDNASIITIHQFCSMVLKSLGVAGDTDAAVVLVESLDDLVGEIVDDRYLALFGQQADAPTLTRDDAFTIAKAAVSDPCSQLRPENPDAGSAADVRLRFAQDVLEEVDRRKRRQGILGYDDLLDRLAKALVQQNSLAGQRMRQRWPIVLVDEFQDTDPVQWEVIDQAFNGHSTLILIGDPKQAIYGFRGGDIHTYLKAARAASVQRTLGTNWRSDKALLQSLQTLMGGAELGHPDVTVHEVDAANDESRLAGAPRKEPFRLRVVQRPTVGCDHGANIPIELLRSHIPADLAADISVLLNSDATYSGRQIRAGDIAIIVDRHQDGGLCRDALARLGIPVVYNGDGDIFQSQAAKDWLCLLEAFDQTHRSGLVRAAACTMFFGSTAESLIAEGDPLTDRVAMTLREWADYARIRGVSAVFEAAKVQGMSRRVLSQRGGERLMTDLAHITQLLQEVGHRERLSLPGLRDWLRQQQREDSGAPERRRRLDSDAGAVQIMTVFVAKGLQFPVVYLPFAFNRYVRTKDDVLLYHDQDETRCLYIGGKNGPGRSGVAALNRLEAARDNIRTTYVALTRAQSQVVAWWAPTQDEINGGLSRLLRGRRVGDVEVPVKCNGKISDDDAWATFKSWESAGGPAVEKSVIVAAPAKSTGAPPESFDVRHFHRWIDTTWRRTSYSALIRAAETHGVSSEPEVVPRDDEPEIIVTAESAALGADTRSPMADLPRGTTFGDLVHAVLETADPSASDLAEELANHARTHLKRLPVDLDPAVLATGMIPMHDTPLGSAAAGLTLREIGARDRLRELRFEMPLAGGDIRSEAPDIRLSAVGELWRSYLSDDVLAPYSERLMSQALGGQPLRGYLSGSIDVVLRLPEQRYLVIDYKTNYLGDTAADYSPARLRSVMLHSDYPLQALASGGLRSRPAFGRRALFVHPRNVRAVGTRNRWPAVRGVQLGAPSGPCDGVVGPT